MPYIVKARELSFQKTKTGSPTVPDGPEEIVPGGAPVPEYVTTFVVSALEAAGLVVFATDARAVVTPNVDVPASPRTPEQPVVLPSDPNGVPPVLADFGNPEAATSTPVDVEPVKERQPARQLAPLPKASDSKETWEQYATNPEIGMPQGEAESMSKADLVAEVKARHARATA